jgi:hypothetical protein
MSVKLAAKHVQQHALFLCIQSLFGVWMVAR